MSVNVTPMGRAPVSLSEEVGYPGAVTLKKPRVSAVNVNADALVMAGAPAMNRLKLCEALGLTPLVAMMVSG